MNTTLREIHERKSVRVFEDKPVPAEVKAQILDAALQAPTAGNQMLYTILDVTDPALKETLAVTCDHQPFIAKAPLVLIFLADCRRWLDMYTAAGVSARRPGPGDLLLACADALIAAQNTVVAAQALGLGSCYIGDILENCEQHRALLHLDDYTLPACMLVLGYPTEQQRNRIKPPRFNKEYIVRENTYRCLSAKELRDMYRGHAPEQDFDESIAAFCRRKYESDFSREMNRSAALYLENFLPEKAPEKV